MAVSVESRARVTPRSRSSPARRPIPPSFNRGTPAARRRRVLPVDGGQPQRNRRRLLRPPIRQRRRHRLQRHQHHLQQQHATGHDFVDATRSSVRRHVLRLLHTDGRLGFNGVSPLVRHTLTRCHDLPDQRPRTVPTRPTRTSSPLASSESCQPSVGSSTSAIWWPTPRPVHVSA